MVYYNQGRMSEAIETLEKAMNIATQAGYESTPEFQDFSYGLNELKKKFVVVAELEELLKNWERNRLQQLQVQLNEFKLEDLVKDVNTNPYILEGYLWEKDRGKLYLEKILELFPKEINEEPILNTKGFLLAFLTKHDEALACFERALALNPTSIIASTGMSLCKINKQEVDQALNILEKYQSTNTYLIIYMFSFAYLKLKDYLNAEAYAKKVLELKPDFLPAFNVLGTIYFLKKDLENAQKYWQDSLNLNPAYLKPYSNLGLIYFTQQQYDKAEDIFKSLLTLDINDIYRLNMLARIYFKTGQSEKVEWILKRILLLDPKNKDALLSLAGQYYNVGNYRKAEIYYKKVIELDPHDLKSLELLMNTYRGMGNSERANEIQKKITELEN